LDGWFTAKDKPIRFGKNNYYTYAEQPTVIGQGFQRKINSIVPFLLHKFCTFVRRITVIYNEAKKEHYFYIALWS